MSFYFEKEGFSGFAHWMKKQSHEELEHAYAMADYIIKRGGMAKVDKIDVVFEFVFVNVRVFPESRVERFRPLDEETSG